MRIKGVNLGGWLLMEGYILGGRNIAESEFKSLFKKRYGKKELERFETLFRDTFIQEKDFKIIKEWGANCIRVPFHYRLIEKAPFKYDKKGFSYLEKVFRWAQDYDLKVILDLHAACGCQNEDWHSDSQGEALLWKKKIYQERTFRVWEEIVNRFKNRKPLLGYDILNEPVTEDLKVLVNFYKELIKRIKACDNKHIIFLEGNMWATQIDFLKPLLEENIYISIHVYQPIDFTFNFYPYLKYPGRIKNTLWNKSKLRRYLESYCRFAQKNKTEIFVGEFGINWRGGFWGEEKYLVDLLDVFEEFKFGYTWWTYKSIKTYTFPDGLLQYLKNSKYVKREGPYLGWENYLDFWDKEKEEIVSCWNTDNFLPNQNLINILKRYFKR